MLDEQVKNELREVRYYFSRKANMDALSINAGVSRAKALAEKYVNAIRQAPARLYDLFGCLYIVDINVCMIGFGKTNQQIFMTSVANNQFLTASKQGKVLKKVKYHLFDKDYAENNKI